MTQVNLYRYQGVNGYIVSPIELPTDYVLMCRIVAGENKLLTDRENVVTVIDVELDNINQWYEVDKPENYDGMTTEERLQFLNTIKNTFN